MFSQTSYAKVSDKEFRGVWIATTTNIDWPSERGLSNDKQQKEILEILDRAAALNLNTVIFQARSASDAFYQSEIEPWSRYLTGIQGKAPEPFYDPLSFIIEETHKRGMLFYAWFNTFRVKNRQAELLDTMNIFVKHPAWGFQYGEKTFLDPGNPMVREHVKKVVCDVVKRYQVDGVLFDDYFYPYPENGAEINDNETFTQYRGVFSQNGKKQWRRGNTNVFISELGRDIQKIKPEVKFGISPFGVWRNKSNDIAGSATKAGVTSYDNLYADVRLWMQKGWIDFVIPQIYWQRNHPAADYTTLLKWWANQPFDGAVYIALANYKSGTDKGFKSDEIIKQIELARKEESIDGISFYSSNHLKRDPFGLNKQLTSKIFTEKVLIPPVRKNDKPIEAPWGFEAIEYRTAWVFKWNNNGSASRYAVYENTSGKNNKLTLIRFTSDSMLFIPKKEQSFSKKSKFCVTAIHTDWNESAPSVLSEFILKKQ